MRMWSLCCPVHISMTHERSYDAGLCPSSLFAYRYYKPLRPSRHDCALLPIVPIGRFFIFRLTLSRVSSHQMQTDAITSQASAPCLRHGPLALLDHWPSAQHSHFSFKCIVQRATSVT